MVRSPKIFYLSFYIIILLLELLGLNVWRKPQTVFLQSNPLVVSILYPSIENIYDMNIWPQNLMVTKICLIQTLSLYVC